MSTLRSPTLRASNVWIGTLCIGLLCVPLAQATEGGGSSYPLGVNTVGAGKMPPPGFTEFFYLSDYSANKTLDGEGDKKQGIHNFDLNVQALSIRVDYVYQDFSILGAKLASRLALPLIKGDISFDVDTPRGRVHRSDHQEGVGDLTVVPFVLGWSSPRYHQLLGLDVFAPIGSYDKDRLFNPGRNTWAYGPWYSFTAYPLENLEVSAKLIYMINGENSETNYRSGREFNADYNIGYNITREWQVGVNGYLYKQLSDDEKNGETYLDGNRGQVAAIGPAIKYQTPAIGFVMKWQHETKVENRAEGDRIWLQAVYRF